MNRRLPDYIAVGIIEKSHGVRGQVRVKPLTDSPPRFNLLTTIFVEFRSGERKEFEISRVIVHEKHVYLKLKGVDDREQAQRLRGAFLMIKREELLPLEEDEFYHFEIEGFEVRTVSGEYLGIIDKVWDLAANPVFVVRKENEEYLIPVIKDVIKEIDKRHRKVVITPLEGLLE